MIIRLLVILAILGLGLHLIFKWATKAWKKADVEQKMEDYELEEELCEKIEEFETNEVKENHKTIQEFVEESE
ncbi:MAG: hypothetical protein MI717_04325 [Spirochaetales bacterium]|nr:hypothetical protein [Spirochaetales bacterium]